MPVDDRRRVCSRLAPCTREAHRAALAARSARAARSQQVPVFTRTRTGPVFQRYEAGAVHHDDVEALVLLAAVVRAADGEPRSGSREADPVLRSWCPRRVAPRLVRATGEGDEVALVVHSALRPSLHARKLRSRRRCRAAQHVDRAGQLGRLELELAYLSQLGHELERSPNSPRSWRRVMLITTPK